MVDKLKRASLHLAFSRVYDRLGPIASMRLSRARTRHTQGEWPLWPAVAISYLLPGGEHRHDACQWFDGFEVGKGLLPEPFHGDGLPQQLCLNLCHSLLVVR
jgi:hypothetical protein